jgi:putative DNA primase/helicase
MLGGDAGFVSIKMNGGHPMPSEFYLNKYHPASDSGQAISSIRVSFKVIADTCLAHAERLVAEWLPEGRREGQEWVALNPTRADSHRGSFKVNLVTGQWADFATGDKGGDLISLYGYLYGLKNGQAATRLVETLGLAGSHPATTASARRWQPEWTPLTPVPADAPPAPAAHPKHGPPSAVWTYRDAAEHVLFQVYRFDLAAGKKQILPLTYCQNKNGQCAWRWQGLEAPRPLYNLHLLAARPNNRVMVNEGEKAADAAATLLPEYVATTSPHGCQSPHKADWAALSGKHVLIWPDADEPGRAYAEAVAALVFKVGAASVHILNIAVFGDVLQGWDAADALAAGWTTERVMEIVRNPTNWLTPAGCKADTSHDARPVINWVGGELTAAVDAAEAALLANTTGAAIYQRGTLLTRIIKTAATTVNHIKRPAGALQIVPVESGFLVERFTQVARWQKFDARTKKWVVINAPTLVVETYLARLGNWNCPALTGVIEAPTLRPDGSILQTPGYDPKTGLFFDPGTTQFEPILETPTLHDARNALAELRDLLAGFPFVADFDRAVAEVALLTALLRKSVRTAPLFAFSAPVMASGKSLLADCVALLATGRPAAVWTYTNDPEETRKHITAALLAGDGVICIDNVSIPLESDWLCSVLTQETVDDRILGVSKTVKLSTASTWLVTGNNLEVRGDLSTRTLLCRLDAKIESPEEREFAVNLYEWIPAHRGQLVHAALTILRSYHVAGRPKQLVKQFGRFEEWSNWARSALVWAGEDDPCKARLHVAQSDPARQQLRALLVAWYGVFDQRQVTTSEVIQAVAPTLSGNVETYAHPGGADLRQALLAIAGSDGKIVNPRILGRYFAKNRDRIENGYRLEQVGEHGTRVLWRVTVSAVLAVSHPHTRKSVSLQQNGVNKNSTK